jgi:hypothetical protein
MGLKPAISRLALQFSRGAALISGVLFLTLFGVRAEDGWAEALSRMPLGQSVGELNRTNCAQLMLGALRSNQVVQALVFMPGATDEFYMFRRAKAELTNASPTLLDAVRALTNQTLIRASFRAPFLLLHTDEDSLQTDFQSHHEPTANRLKTTRLAGRQFYVDRDWDFVQPILRRALRVDLRPWQHSTDSWHFYRHNFAGWNLNGWETLECAALAGKSRFSVHRGQVVFEADPRVRTNLRFEDQQK